MLLAAILLPAPLGAFPSTDVRAVATPAEPALWVLSDADTTIYLFGTFHALDERSDWFGREVRAAFDSADQLVLETLVPTNPIDLLNALSRHSLAAPLVPGAPVVAGGSTFAASARQAMNVGKQVGLSLDRGADAILRRTAEAAGKPVDGLESFDAQLGMFTGLPAAAPATGPQPDPRDLILTLRTAWQHGNSAEFAAVLATLEAQSPQAYRRLFVDRNSDWAGWIAHRMQQPGTVFVAVGTGHLIGRDSVQAKLAARGFRAMRVN